MKASEIAKKAGLKSLKEAADLTQTTPNGLCIMRKNHPKKFLSLMYGAGQVKGQPNLLVLIKEE